MLAGNSEKFLFSHLFQKIGFGLFLCGIIALFLRFGLDIKPDFLEIKVFAVYSSFFETRFFALIGNNISEEIVMLLLLAGLFFITLSREKNESGQVWELRLKSFLLAVYANCIFLTISILFVFGWGFLGVLAANLVSYLLFYNLIFRYFLLFKKKNKFSYE